MSSSSDPVRPLVRRRKLTPLQLGLYATLGALALFGLGKDHLVPGDPEWVDRVEPFLAGAILAVALTSLFLAWRSSTSSSPPSRLESTKPPPAAFIFAVDGLHIEPNLDQAVAYLEPIDVENGEYEAVYDQTGRRYDITVVAGTTVLEATDEADPDELIARLRNDAGVRASLGTSFEGPSDVADAYLRR